MRGGGAAGVATLGAAGVEVAQQELAETQTAIPPLVPYLDTLRWHSVFRPSATSQSVGTTSITAD